MHPNAQVVMGGFQAFATGDEAGLKETFADDATWHAGGRNRWSGDHVGTDAIMRLMMGIKAEAQIDNQPHAVLADDEHVVVLINSTSTRGDRRYEGNSVFIFHVDDGVVTEAWSIPGDQYALDAFWQD